VEGGSDPPPLPYDTLIASGGSFYSYFGHDEWRPFAHEVKSLESALGVRHRILAAFENAELEADPERQAAWLTFVVVGAGPTGVEMAGQIAEIARDTLPRDFRAIDPARGRVLLIDQVERVLPSYPPSLSRKAEESLEQLGVTPLTGRAVVGTDDQGVTVKRSDGREERIVARTVIWAAGVEASPLAKKLGEASGAEVDRAGRVTVEPDLTLPGHPEVIALGDMVRVRDRHGHAVTLPGLAPVAMQQGRYAARLVRRRLAGRGTRPFRYFNKGDMATIGRARAVVNLPGRIRLGGPLAWVFWLGLHLYFLIGFENRLLVLMRWAFSFVTRGRGARLITGGAAMSGATPPEA
jgi:NADH dehydrogenase